ncbi:MAG: hypothetical protein GY754_05300 [bacterium]|nr:hypothetical protein [bacterium]
MIVNDLFSFKNQLNSEGILFCYSGLISQGIIEEIGEAVRQKVGIAATVSASEKVFGMLIEQLVNIANYSVKKKIDPDSDSEFSEGLVLIEYDGTNYYVACGNLIENRTKKTLIEWLEKIKSLNKEELKNLYKKQLKNNILPGSKGAGLGFIVMARKSSGPLEYYIQEIDKKYSYFSVKVMI